MQRAEDRLSLNISSAELNHICIEHFLRDRLRPPLSLDPDAGVSYDLAATAVLEAENLTTADAPGKVILVGEHAVVYGRPAIAVPVAQVRARAVVEDAPSGQGLTIRAVDLHLSHRLGKPITDTHPAYPLDMTVRHTLQHFGVRGVPDLTLTISSTVPVARGLGSGAAVATAIVRSLAQHLGHSLAPSELSDLVFQTEIIHHGTPSGVDNTVIAFEQPVYFVKGQPMQTLQVKRPFWLVIGDTGVASLTRTAVAKVRRAWQTQPESYEKLFDSIGGIAEQAAQAIATGEISRLGELMNRNQLLLEALGVSSPELENLVQAARKGGAMGAKLCGGGCGGNMLALVAPENVKAVASALEDAGAANVIATTVRATERG